MKLQDLIIKSEKEGLSVTTETAEKLVKYAELLKEWNEKINLTAITEPEEVYEKHFYDSMIPLFHYPIHGRICDVGTGAGFPGLVWAIVKPELQVTLLEPTGKRCTFLAEVVKALDLKNVEIVNDRAELYVKDAREQFDIVTARAVAGLQMLSELCIPLVKTGGIFLPLKGDQGAQEAADAKRAIGMLGGKIREVFDAYLSSGDHRTIIVIDKEKKTPAQYPRAYARIKKQPL